MSEVPLYPGVFSRGEWGQAHPPKLAGCQVCMRVGGRAVCDASEGLAGGGPQGVLIPASDLCLALSLSVFLSLSLSHTHLSRAGLVSRGCEPGGARLVILPKMTGCRHVRYGIHLIPAFRMVLPERRERNNRLRALRPCSTVGCHGTPELR